MRRDKLPKFRPFMIRIFDVMWQDRFSIDILGFGYDYGMATTERYLFSLYRDESYFIMYILWVEIIRKKRIA